MKNVKNQKMRWKAGDYLKLEKAVADFNAKISRLESSENKAYLPAKITETTQEIKQQIYTKNELQRYIKTLRDFTEKGAEKLIETEGGEKLTTWEKNVITQQANIRAKQLKAQLKPYTEPNKQGVSLKQMGNTEARRIEANLKRVEDVFKLGGEKFKSALKYIKSTGTLDYELKKATVYRKNYMDVIQRQFSNLDGYAELKRAFNSHSDPLDFYKFIEKSGDINVIDISYESNQTMSQEQFYEYLDILGIEYESKTENKEVVDNQNE